MSKVRDGNGEPRAVVHKRILEVAEDRPEASLTDIAAEVSGATPDLVERVLTEYGDPNETEAEDTMAQNGQSAPETDESIEGRPETDGTGDEPEADDAPEADDGAGPEPGDERAEPSVDLTQKQLETVSLVHERPEASQGDIAAHLDVSRATVSRRLNEIPGFEWADRETFTSNLFDSTDLTPEIPPEETAATGTADQQSAGVEDESAADAEERALEDIEERITAVEGHLESVAGRLDEGTDEEPALRPELAHKVVHAAMASERIDEEEEIELIAALLDQ